jgi:hypothetical protein
MVDLEADKNKVVTTALGIQEAAEAAPAKVEVVTLVVAATDNQAAAE